MGLEKWETNDIIKITCMMISFVTVWINSADPDQNAPNSEAI